MTQTVFARINAHEFQCPRTSPKTRATCHKERDHEHLPHHNLATGEIWLDDYEDARRPETGPMRFDRDWPGLFMRGDDAIRFAVVLKATLDAMPEEPGESIHRYLRRKVLVGLLSTLESCILMPDPNGPGVLNPMDIAVLRTYEECAQSLPPKVRR
jgi:hypothetical protein